MTPCEITRSRFADALYGELDPEAQKKFTQHLESCSSCAGEFSKLQQTLSIMDERVRIEPETSDSERFWETLRPKLEPERQPTLIFRPAFRVPAWSYAVAAVLLVAVGIFIGRRYSSVTEPAAPAASVATSTVPAAVSDSTTRQALAYLERSRNLLLGVTNLDEQSAGSFDLASSRQASRKLIEQGNVLTVALNRPSQQLMRQLVQDLQIILLQLANIEVRPGVPAIELVKKGVDQKSILLKINLEEMRAMAGQPSKVASDKRHSEKL